MNNTETKDNLKYFLYVVVIDIAYLFGASYLKHWLDIHELNKEWWIFPLWVTLMTFGCFLIITTIGGWIVLYKKENE